jgi:hypothetical protein
VWGNANEIKGHGHFLISLLRRHMTKSLQAVSAYYTLRATLITADSACTPKPSVELEGMRLVRGSNRAGQ